MSAVRSRTLLNLALIALAAGLGAIAYLRPGHRPPPPQPPLTTLAVKDITHIRIERRGHPTIKLQRRGGVWRITAPMHARANTMRVEGVEDAAGAHSLAQYPAAHFKLATAGLAPPKVRLWLNDHEFDFGGTAPINQWRYVKVGDTVHMISDTIYPFLIMPPTAFVDLALLPPGAGIVELKLPALTLRRGPKDHWSITPPHPGASAARIRALLRHWRDARALYIGHDTGGADKGRVTLRLQGRKAPLHFIIRRTHPGLVLARPGTGLSYHLGSTGLHGLLTLPPPAHPGKPADGTRPPDRAHPSAAPAPAH